jgi:non-heme chloroperoxidase
MHAYQRAARRAAQFAFLLALMACGDARTPSASDDAAARARAMRAPTFDYARLTNGLRMHYAAQGDSGGPVVILLHGYSDSWFSFSRILPMMPAMYRVYALDQRGHGNSDRPRSNYTMHDMALDVVAFMNAMAIDQAIIVGHSMGSFVAQQVAAAIPNRVSGMVLLGSTTAPTRIVGVRELEQAVRTLSDPVSLEFIREFQASTVHKPVPAAFMDRVVSESAKLPAHVWHEVMDGLLATSRVRSLGAHRIPTMLAWGDRDTMFPRSEQDALLEALPGSELKTYSETGHSPHWEVPNAFIRDLVQFLASVTA